MRISLSAGGRRASPGDADRALLALRRAAFTGALEKPPVGGPNITPGEVEAQKETFWRGHAKVRMTRLNNIGMIQKE